MMMQQQLLYKTNHNNEAINIYKVPEIDPLSKSFKFEYYSLFAVLCSLLEFNFTHIFSG